MIPKLPPENIVRAMSAADRQALRLSTAQEKIGRAQSRHELGEQKIFRSWLALNEIRYSSPRTDKKSTVPRGIADFIVFLPCGQVAVIEFKSPGKSLTEEQKAFQSDLLKLHHTVYVFRWAEEAIELVKSRLL